MSDLRNVSASPHVRSKLTTSKIMFMVILALLPTTIYGIFWFGFNAALLIAVCITCCVATEFIYEKLMKLPVTVGDFSAIVTGLLLALNLPSTATWWMAALGSVFAILIVKMLFGGLGQNFMNPALGARCFLLICFTGRMTDFNYDGMTSATPLAMVKAGESVNLMDMFLGRIPGTIGEVSAVAILVGGIILVIFNVIDFRIPFTYIVTLLIFMGIFGGHGWNMEYLAAQICGGGILLGAFFMATDYVTSPITKNGRIVFGICLGILTGIFRVFSASSEGVSYAIIICNLLVPLIEKITMPKPFGKGGEI